MTHAYNFDTRRSPLRRKVLAALLASIACLVLAAAPALADSGSGGGGGGGSGSSGSGSNSGSGSGSSNGGKDGGDGGGGDTSGKNGGGDSGKNSARDGVKRGDVLPVDRIIASAREAHPGQVLALNLRKFGSALVYDVKLLDSAGSVVVVRIDARTAVALAVRGG